MARPLPSSTLFPYTTLFRSSGHRFVDAGRCRKLAHLRGEDGNGWRDDRGGRGAHDRPRYRSEEHTSELQSRGHLVCRLLLEKKKNRKRSTIIAATAVKDSHE